MKKHNYKIRNLFFGLGLCFLLCCFYQTTSFAISITEKKQEESTLKPPILNGLIWQKNKYVLYVDGNLITTPGWRGVSGEKYLINEKGDVSARMVQLNDIWFYYQIVNGSNRWKKQKKCWVSVFEKDYYFDRTGKCTQIYDNQSKWLYVIEEGKMRSAEQGLYSLKNKKNYYFNQQGIRSSTKGYERVLPELYIKTAKKGHVIAKLERSKNRWRFYRYDSKKKKLVKQKNLWKTIDKKSYFFNARGICTKIYDAVEQTFQEYQNGELTLVKSEIRQVEENNYYFNEEGIRQIEPGLYETTSGQIILMKEQGVIEELVAGQVMEKVFQEGKMTLCRIKDENYMYYYNGDGTLKRKLDLHGKMVALTYDDGPSQYTNEILDILEQNGARATFFVVGNRVSSYATVVKRTFEMGCELGNHSYSHPDLTGLSQTARMEQIRNTTQAVQNITGKSMEYLRPPGGSHNSAVRSSVGMPLILWSIDTRDWATRNASSTISAVLNHVKDGDIVLMHDLYQQTANASKSIIPELVRRGYQLVTISELEDCRGDMEDGKVYYSMP